jgi:hypothetical protein
MAAPEELVALQPVQLVSMVEVPGKMEKVPLEELMVVLPPPQPVTRMNTGIAAMDRTRPARRAWAPKRRHATAAVPGRRRLLLGSVSISINASRAFPPQFTALAAVGSHT